MRFLEEFPYEVDVRPHVEIPLSDGVVLSARVWRPRADGRPLPAILEYIPYRKRFGTVHRDDITHGYLSGHGYVCVRVDLRGSGESEGVLTGEYLEQELADGEEIIRWIAEQPWCDGNVGMMGISWGGFNALQVAARRPPALKAIMAASATDDRYADDVHNMGGCLLGDNLSWASVMFAYNSLPPDPALVGERWRRMWFERLEGSGLWLDTWLRHQRRDEFWRHGSICEDYAAVQCPVMLVSGWADGYSNAVFRMLERLEVPRLGLVGPWAHTYPHFGRPGPAIDFLCELKRWWDCWLKGIDNGIADEPMLRAWIQDSVPPTTTYERRPGRWVAVPSWPSNTTEMRSFRLVRNGLVAEEEMESAPKLPASASLQSPLTLGLFAGKWCSYASGPDLAHDQRQEDGGAMTFDTEALASDVEILGAPVLELRFSVDRPVAMVAARLSDVRPNGAATRFTYGLLNLTHRNGSADPEPLVPGEVYTARVLLNYIAQKIPKSHRIRLALSTSYWPLAWPPPRPVQMDVHFQGSRLTLPTHPAGTGSAVVTFNREPVGARPNVRRLVRPEQHDWLVHRELASDESVLEVIDDRGAHFHEATGLTVDTKGTERYISRGNDFDSVRGETTWERSLARDGWSIHTRTHTVLTSTPDIFRIHASLDAYEDEHRVFCRSWNLSIERDLV